MMFSIVFGVPFKQVFDWQYTLLWAAQLMFDVHIG